mgnify:CR=1 FL=1
MAEENKYWTEPTEDDTAFWRKIDEDIKEEKKNDNNQTGSK